MNESKSPILNVLEKQFGKYLYSNANFNLNNEIMQQCFNLLNKSLFANQLPNIDIQCIPTSRIEQIFQQYNNKKHADEQVAVYFPIADFNRVNFIKKNQIPNVHYLMLNTDFHNITFAFAINCLCHEMIHYLDTIKGDVLLKYKMHIDKMRNNEPTEFDEHDTDVFIKKSDQFNKQGLTIIPYIPNDKFQDYVELSVYRMKKLEETENQLMSISSKSTVDVSHIGNELYSIAF